MTFVAALTDRPPPRFRRHSWSDPETRMSNEGAFSKRVQRLAGGAFSSEVHMVHAGPLRFGIERLEGPIRVHGLLPDGVLYASVSHGTDLRLDGIRAERPTLALYGAGTAFDATVRGPMWNAMLVVGRSALPGLQDPEDPLGAWFDASRTQASRPRSRGGRLAGLLLTLARRIDADDGSLIGAAGGPALDALLAALREALSAPAPVDGQGWARGPGSRRRLALAAEAMVLEADDESPPSVESLCRALGIGERSLQLSFREQFGTNVRSFMRTARLQKAHAMLLRHGDRMTVTDIATHFGFWHLGRFARYYRETFGCAPSVTLRNGWGERACPVVR